MAKPEFLTHRKYKRLCRTFPKLHKTQVYGHVDFVYVACQVAKSPVVGSVEDLEALAEWDGEPGAFAKAMLECGSPGAGLVEWAEEGVLQLHDWEDHATYHVKHSEAMVRYRARKRESRVKHGDARGITPPILSYPILSKETPLPPLPETPAALPAAEAAAPRVFSSEADGLPAPAPDDGQPSTPGQPQQVSSAAPGEHCADKDLSYREKTSPPTSAAPGPKRARRKKPPPDQSPYEVPLPARLDNPTFVEVWHQRIKHYELKHGTMTPYTAQLQLAKMERWGVQRAIQACHNAIQGKWSGIFPPKDAEVPSQSPESLEQARARIAKQRQEPVPVAAFAERIFKTPEPPVQTEEERKRQFAALREVAGLPPKPKPTGIPITPEEAGRRKTEALKVLTGGER